MPADPAILGGIDLVDLAPSTLEALTPLKVSVSSVERKEETLFRTPAATPALMRHNVSRLTASRVPELFLRYPACGSRKLYSLLLQAVWSF